MKSIKELRKEHDWVLVPTDKTNKWVPTKVNDYINWMQGHLDKKCKVVTHERLSSTYKEAQELLEKFEPLMNKGEYEFIEQFIKTRRIPMPRLLIKDHKPTNDDGTYPTRLLVPATNFTQCFAKLSYKAIKAIFDANDINPMKRTIIQSSHLKMQLEGLDLKADNCTICSLDIVDMYPSIQHKLIRKSIEHYSRNLSEEEHTIINAALEMQQFSMGNTLVMFRDKYYEYGTADDPFERSLTIGGYDSAWMADLVGGYIFDLAEDHFNMTKFFGLYRDDGNVAFEDVRSIDDLKQWLHDFQSRVNEIVGNDGIKFTMDIWKPEEESRTVIPKVMNVVGGNAFPYLDMEMAFDEENDLCFAVYTKPNFQSKYLDVKSTHTAAMKSSVPRGVSIRLAGLTTRTAANENSSLSSLYPKVHATLKKSGHLKGDSRLPKLGTILNNREREIMEAQLRKEEWKKDKRNVYILARYSGNWRTPITNTIKRLKKKYGLGWLRVRMLHKRHQNLKEMLLGDIATKVMKGVSPTEYVKATQKKKCSCRQSSKVDGKCLWNEECETTGVIYKITCKCCNDFYLGKTQRGLKKRCQEHYQAMGKFFDKQKTFETRLSTPLSPDVPSASSEASSYTEGGTNKRITRSVARARESERELHPPTTPANSSTNTGMDHLLALFSVLRQGNSQGNLMNPPSTIYEDRGLETRENESIASSVSSTQPRNLADQPTFSLSNHPSSQQSISVHTSNRSIATHTSSSSDSQSSQATELNAFALAFGGEEALQQVSELEAARATILRPILENEFNSIQCSQLTKHMWSHAKHLKFQDKNALYAWVRAHWEVEIVHKSSMISNMKTAGTRNCSLCMQERIQLFHAFNKKKTPTNNLMNSKDEMYGQCSCKTRFLRLTAVGNAGADEATS